MTHIVTFEFREDGSVHVSSSGVDSRARQQASQWAAKRYHELVAGWMKEPKDEEIEEVEETEDMFA